MENNQQIPGKEIWRPVKGYEDSYEVSNFGRIKSLKRGIRKNGEIGKYPAKILTNSVRDGYCAISLCKKGKSRAFKAHRLAAIAFIANPNNKPHINHKNGVRNDNRIENLEWCTQEENNQYTAAVLKRPGGVRGGRCHFAKMKESNVRQLFRHIKSGKSAASFAEKVNITVKHIKAIIQGVEWKHLGLDWELAKKMNRINNIKRP